MTETEMKGGALTEDEKAFSLKEGEIALAPFQSSPPTPFSTFSACLRHLSHIAFYGYLSHSNITLYVGITFWRTLEFTSFPNHLQFIVINGCIPENRCYHL